MSAMAGTVAMWGYLADPQPSTDGQYFFGHTAQGSWSDRIQFYMQVGTGPDRFRGYLHLGLGSSHTTKTNITELQLETWYHVALTWDSGNYVVYVNGQEVARGTYVGPSTIHAVANIGNDGSIARNGAPYECFAGLIDEARVYNRALGAAEVLGVMKGAPYPTASGPRPKEGTMELNTWATLSWNPGDFAVSHDIYFGDNFADVNAGTGGTFWANLTVTDLFVGFPGYPYPNGLVPGTTYYWRIDEVNTANPNSPWKGDVWSFSIAPNTAYNPNPADGAGSVALTTALRWTGGYGSKLHTVYFGDKFDDVNNATTGGAMSGSATYNPGPLQRQKVYHWRVDEFDGAATYKGPVWSFATLGAVGNPYPANGAPSAEMNAMLTWAPSDNAASHQVYFGMDKETLRKADATSPEYKGVRTLGAESYDPGLLAWDSTYYWRIDEVNNTNAASPWKGPLWSFTTGDYLLVDGFESYNDIDTPDPQNHRIFDTWIDGYGTTTNGALVANDLPPYAERAIVHRGAQSMPYRYDNNLKFSEAIRTLTPGQDWTAQGVTRLSLWFRGAAANAAERMYVALNGTAVVYHTNPSAAKISGWTQWVIPLQAFADQGVPLANVTSISIGFGTKGDTTAAGGTGKIYFDDIRLDR
jgi:hypothetical protein